MFLSCLRQPADIILIANIGTDRYRLAAMRAVTKPIPEDAPVITITCCFSFLSLSAIAYSFRMIARRSEP